MKFSDKFMKPEKVILGDTIQLGYVFTYMWILARKSMTAKLQSVEPQRLGRVRDLGAQIDLIVKRK